MVTHFAALVHRIVLPVVLLLAAAAPPARATEIANPVQRCQELLPAFTASPARLTIEMQQGGAEAPTGVRLAWPADNGHGEAWIICWFLPHKTDGEAWQIHQLSTSKYGLLRRYDIQQLYKLLRLQQYAPQQFPAADTPVARGLYVLQQAINALSLGCVYGLIAIGFTLVYGITRVVNFAFGEVFMLGAFITLLAVTVIRSLGGEMAVSALLLVLAGTAAIMAAYGWAMDRLVFQPLRLARTSAALIAALGLALVFKDSVRLLQGPKTRYLLIEQLESWPLVTGRGFDVIIRKGHLLVILATGAILAALWWVHGRTRFGRCQRACAQDLRMAALVGVPIDRTIGLTFMLGSAITGAGGMFAAAQYGVVNFHMGTLMGFKALTAALLGGIGSLPGAVLGGMVIALVEVFTAAYLGSGWKDIAVFAVLVLVLLYRPAGLLGTLPTVTADERP